jgi:hypothetical protein
VRSLGEAVPVVRSLGEAVPVVRSLGEALSHLLPNKRWIFNTHGFESE